MSNVTASKCCLCTDQNKNDNDDDDDDESIQTQSAWRRSHALSVLFGSKLQGYMVIWYAVIFYAVISAPTDRKESSTINIKLGAVTTRPARDRPVLLIYGIRSLTW